MQPYPVLYSSHHIRRIHHEAIERLALSRALEEYPMWGGMPIWYEVAGRDSE